eukprot:Skav217974  [mRNA]  locus=scaffold496:47203:52733:- [translate_table: standard]
MGRPYDFPFDRHIISLKHCDFVWRTEKDDDDFFDSMQIVWLAVESKSILPEWIAGQSDLLAIHPVKETLKSENVEVCSKFWIDLRIERGYNFYVRQIFLVSSLITIASCSPLFMPLEDMGDRLLGGCAPEVVGAPQLLGLGALIICFPAFFAMIPMIS